MDVRPLPTALKKLKEKPTQVKQNTKNEPDSILKIPTTSKIKVSIDAKITQRDFFDAPWYKFTYNVSPSIPQMIIKSADKLIIIVENWSSFGLIL